jgi:hypothetical protein
LATQRLRRFNFRFAISFPAVWRTVLISGAVEMVEVPWEEGARLMNECTYLLATDVGEVDDLELALTIVEAKARTPITTTEDMDPISLLAIGGKPIEEDETCRLFQLLFERNHMISYTILNESYGKYPAPPEVFTGKLFRTFSHSHLLEFTERTTCASRDYPGALMHFGIACLDHVINVICTSPPKIAVSRQKTTSATVN